MKKEKYILIIFTSILLISLVYAITLNSFDNFSIPGNLNFSGNETISKNITINRYANFTQAILNLTDNYHTSICYQESANTSNQGGSDGNCNLNYNGNYTISGSGGDGNYSRLIDGSWSTAYYRGTIYVNYTKPNNGLNGALWRVKTQKFGENNITLPTRCLNANPNILQLNILYTSFGTFDKGTRILCHNGTSWENVTADLHGDETGDVVYEEAIYWNISKPINNSYLQISNQSKSWWLKDAIYEGANANLNKLNDSSSSTNLNFNGSQNQTVYLDIPKFANVTSAILNIFGKNLNNNLVTYFKFEDSTTNSVITDSANNVNGTLRVNNNLENTNLHSTTGVFGNAINFNKTNQNISLTLTNFNTTNYSITFWVKNLSALASNGIFVFYLESSNFSMGTSIRAFSGYYGISNELSIYYNNSETPGSCSGNYPSLGAIVGGPVVTAPYNLSEYTFVALVFNSSNSGGFQRLLYINNNSTQYSIFSNPYIKCGNNRLVNPSLRIGSPATANLVTGNFSLDDFRIYNYSLDANEVNSLYLNNITTSNTYLEVGNIDGTREWNYTGNFTGTNTTNDFSARVNNYTSNCSFDSENLCQVPLLFHSDSAGILQISNINISYNNVSITPDFSSKLNSVINKGTCSLGTLSGNNCTIPLNFHSDTSGILSINEFNSTYNYVSFVNLNSPSNNSDQVDLINFNCSAEGYYGLSNVTFNLWNSTSLVNSTTQTITGTSNSTIFSITLINDGNYLWNCDFIDNQSQTFSAENNYSFTADFNAPVILLNYPDANILDNQTIISVNYTPQIVLSDIDTCKIYTNISGSWEVNQTDTTVTKNVVNIFNLTDVPNGWFTYNIWCNATNGNEAFSQNNKTFAQDKASPTLNITSPASSITSRSFNLIVSYSDISPASACTYNITLGELVMQSNTALNVVNFTKATSVAIDGDYTINVWCNDSFGKNGTTSKLVNVNTQVTPPAGGGGGGGTVVISGEAGWSMEVASGIALYEKSLSPGNSLRLSIDFENLGTSSRKMTLSCVDINGSVCQYVTFQEQTFTLPLIKDTKIKQYFTISLPEDLVPGQYKFNIKAVDDLNQEGAITVNLNTELNAISEVFSKIGGSTGSGFPIWLIAFLTFVLGLFGFSWIFKKSPLRAIWTLVLTILLTGIVVTLI